MRVDGGPSVGIVGGGCDKKGKRGCATVLTGRLSTRSDTTTT